jgi:hypothetical protein
MYGSCLAVCALALLDTDYADLSVLNILSIAAVTLALVSIITNIIAERRK